MGRPKGSIKAVHIRNYPHCSVCDVKLGSYRSKMCRKHCLVGKKRPDMIGHTWNNGNKYSLGRKMSEETKAKISEAKSGIKLSQEHKEKITTSSKRGLEHHNWKGGISSYDYKERRKFQRFTQQLVFQRDEYTCQVCHNTGGSLQVDHIKSWSKYPELRFEIDNCRTLCMGCHYYITFKRKMPKGIIWGHNLSRRIAS